MTLRCAPLLVLALGLAACPPQVSTNTDASSEASGSDAATAPEAGAPDTGRLPYSPDHTFPPIHVDVGGESLNLCQSWTLNNTEDLWVNSLTMDAGPGWHHSNWVVVSDQYYQGPDGTWPCDDRSFNEAVAGAQGGVFFAQSTQATHEVQQFPAGTAYRIPRRARVIGSVHLINVTAAALDSSIRFQIGAIPMDQVQTRLHPLAIDNRSIDIAPRGRAAITTTCDMATGYRNLTMRGIDFGVYYALPHYHGMGRNMRIEAVGGPRDGMLIYQTSASVGDPLGGMVMGPFDLTGATGVRVTCTYQNSSDRQIRWGVHSTDEMCTLLMYTSSPSTFGGLAGGTATRTTQTDGTVVQDAPCTMTVVPSAL